MKFTKMQGCGNDYIYINCFEESVDDPSALSKELSRRCFSVGGDGVILICPSDKADAKMRMFNADGSEGEMCGNGIRCVGKYIYDRNIARKQTLKIETLSGIKTLSVKDVGGEAKELTVDMGRAILTPSEIPVALSGDSVIDRCVNIDGDSFNITCVSMGNPHCVVFVKDTKSLDLPTLGKKFEHSPLFPKSVNTEFIRVIDKNTLHMRVWERGSGETLACGTGACASVAAAVLCGHCNEGSDVTVRLLGGDLVINYTKERVLMTGAAVTVYDGEIK